MIEGLDRLAAAGLTTTGEVAHRIVINASGILIDAAMVTLKSGGSSVEVGPAGVTVKAPTVALTGDAQVKVGAPMVAIEGSGITQVKGGIVQIN